MALQKPLALLIIIAFIAVASFSACRGHKQSGPLSPEGAELAQQAYQMMSAAEALLNHAPEPLAPVLEPFVEACRKFSNASQRHGAESLKGRDAYDKVFYHASRIQIDASQHPETAKEWESIRTDHVEPIGIKLGYRIE